MSNATRVTVVVVGDVLLSFDRNKTLILRNCLYVPCFRKNLISVSKLFMDGYSVSFDDKVVVKKNRIVIHFGTLVDNLYTLNPITPTIQKMEINNTSFNSNKRKQHSEIN